MDVWIYVWRERKRERERESHWRFKRRSEEKNKCGEVNRCVNDGES